VWLTSLMFFQAMLLVGYLYAHLFARQLGRWHLLLLLLPLINLPIGATLKPAPEAPLLTLLAVLSVHFALPFVVLSTTAVVAQSWLSRSMAGQRHEPYPLYAASNAGSLLALFGYAFLAEPLFGVRAQSFTWTAGYIIYAILVVAAWFTLRPGMGPIISQPKKDSDLQAEAAPTTKDYALWLLLSALPSAFLLTVTKFHCPRSGVISPGLGHPPGPLSQQFCGNFPQQWGCSKIFGGSLARGGDPGIPAVFAPQSMGGLAGVHRLPAATFSGLPGGTWKTVRAPSPGTVSY
jgi:hypothetical protein